MRNVIIGLILFGLAATAYAQCPMAGGPQNHMTKKMEMLDLTLEQQKKIDDIKLQTKKTTIPIKGDIELKRLDIASEMTKDTPSRDKLMKITKEINDLQLKIKQAKLDEHLKIHSLLTPEQRQRMRMPTSGKSMGMGE
jgi:Spy/CpxP family protein refolding chaperone